MVQFSHCCVGVGLSVGLGFTYYKLTQFSASREFNKIEESLTPQCPFAAFRKNNSIDVVDGPTVRLICGPLIRSFTAAVGGSNHSVLKSLLGKHAIHNLPFGSPQRNELRSYLRELVNPDQDTLIQLCWGCMMSFCASVPEEMPYGGMCGLLQHFVGFFVLEMLLGIEASYFGEKVTTDFSDFVVSFLDLLTAAQSYPKDKLNWTLRYFPLFHGLHATFYRLHFAYKHGKEVRKLRQTMRELVELTQKKVKRRMAEGDFEATFLFHDLYVTKSAEEVTDIVFGFLFGSLAPLLNSLIGLVYMVGQDSQVQGAIRAEMESALLKYTIPEMPAPMPSPLLDELRTAKSAVYECLRLLPGIEEFYLLSNGPVAVAGVAFPKKAAFRVAPKDLHYSTESSNQYPTDEFHPARWNAIINAGDLPDADAPSVNDQKVYDTFVERYFPFGAGVRSCVAARFSETWLVLFISILCHLKEVRFTEKWLAEGEESFARSPTRHHLHTADTRYGAALQGE